MKSNKQLKYSNYVVFNHFHGIVVNNSGLDIEKLLIGCENFLKSLNNYTDKINNEFVRIYATGIFQTLTLKEQNRLIIHIYINWGLFFNIIKPDLERFYMEKSLERGLEGMINGLVIQEFRKVVICGSFQQHLKEIDDIMNLLGIYNVKVLSPWTTKVVPETLGTDFILLEGQEPLKNERDAWRHKYEHMDKFRHADAIIVCNPKGVVGKGTMFEFGFMIAHSKRIIFTERPKDLSIPFPYEIGLNF